MKNEDGLWRGRVGAQILEERTNETDEDLLKGAIWRGLDILNCVFSNF